MKKLIALLCTVLMLATLGACGENETSSDISESSVSISETEKTTAEITTEVITDEPTTEEITETENITEASTENLTEAETVQPEKATASSVMDYLINNTSNIGTFVEYDETTDTNELLGRPGQYTSKINFAITTLEQTDENDPKGGSIEVFESHEDAMARYEYIQEIGKKATFLAEYGYVNDYVLLRINFDVAPSDEKTYEEALDTYMNSLS